MQTLTFQQAEAMVGCDLGASEWVLVDQALIDAFADATGDHQFIHVDPVAASASPFGGTIGHGFLTLSLLASMRPPGSIVLKGLRMGVNYGFERVRFLNPVPSGRRIRARHTLLSNNDKGGGRYLLANEVTVEIEDETKPALVAVWLGMQYA